MQILLIVLALSSPAASAAIPDQTAVTATVRSADEAKTSSVQQADFQYPRVAARQIRAVKRPGKVSTNSCQSCYCGFICNDFGYCNTTTGSSCRMIAGPTGCDDCSICSCF
ncbi:MAG TPA: hypothetical protein VF432_31400 [Thermoanaerobaculia bacterium]